MRGHVRKRGKTWTAIYDSPAVDASVKRRQVWRGGFRTKGDAETFLRETLKKVDDGDYVQPSKMLLSDYLTTWCKGLSLTRANLTVRAYKSTVNGHLIKELGHIQLQRLTTGDVSGLYASLVEKGFEPATIARIHNVLHVALDDAVEERLLVRNPADKAKKPKLGKPKRRRTWTARELRAFIESTETDRLHALYRVAALTGMRRGEMLGLRWLDLDLERGRVTISQTVIPTGGKRWEIKPTTKTDHPHTIALDPGTVDVLRNHMQAQKVERALWGDAYEDYDLVFCRENGTPIDPNGFSETFAAAVKRAKLPAIRLHDLRHTHATHLLANGESPKVVQERLGHADVKITLNRYSHVMPGMDAEAANKAASYVFGPEED